ncbi:MAG: hypothetical protein ACK4HW_10170 [Roseinatronobacter sp.]
MARVFVALLIGVFLLPAPRVAADTGRITPEMVDEALKDQGFQVQSITRTLLGRARIIAQKGLIWREVVLDLSSGQILRDYAVEFSSTDLPDRLSGDMPRGGRVLESAPLPVERD